MTKKQDNVSQNPDQDFKTLQSGSDTSCENIRGEIDTRVFLRILQHIPKVDVINFSKDGGDISISVKQEDVLLPEYIQQRHFITRTKFFANFIGELLVRQNIDRFIDLLIDIDTQSYNKVVCGFNHRNFGMSACEKTKTFKFQFHISLIQDILTEDVNRMIKLK